MMFLVILTSIVMLAPFAMYLMGLIKDPFHPMIFAGVASYFLIPHRLITQRAQTFELVDDSFIDPFLVVSIISMLGIYVGWYLGGKRKAQVARLAANPAQFLPSRLGLCAAAFAIVAGISHYTYKDIGYTVEVSGYSRDLNRLWIAGAILAVQAICLSAPSYRLPLFVVLGGCLYPPIERFLSYGQRGDTFRMATLCMLAYMMFGKRPSKAVFLVGVTLLGLTLSTLAMTRSVVDNGDAPNRIEALGRVIPEYLRGNLNRVDTGDEHVFGAAVVNTVRETCEYGYGLSVTVGIVGRFLPRQIFPMKDEFFNFSGAFDGVAIRTYTGLSISWGSAPTGFANGFGELAWACPLIWIVVGYFYRRFWDKATAGGDLRSLGYLMGFMMAIFYALTQDVMTGEVNLIYVLLPLTLVYNFSKVSQPRDLPELATR